MLKRFIYISNFHFYFLWVNQRSEKCKGKDDIQEFLSINVGFEVEESRYKIYILSSKSRLHSLSQTQLWSKLSTFVLTTDCREKLLGFTWKCVTNSSCLHCREMPASRNSGRIAQKGSKGRISGALTRLMSTSSLGMGHFLRIFSNDGIFFHSSLLRVWGAPPPYTLPTRPLHSRYGLILYSEVTAPSTPLFTPSTAKLARDSYLAVSCPSPLLSRSTCQNGLSSKKRFLFLCEILWEWSIAIPRIV